MGDRPLPLLLDEVRELESGVRPFTETPAYSAVPNDEEREFNGRAISSA